MIVTLEACSGFPAAIRLMQSGSLSFESLTDDCSAFLGVLSYITPDDIHQALFEASDSPALPESLRFCTDEFMWVEVPPNIPSKS